MGWGFEIRIPENIHTGGPWIPDPGVEKAPDHGSALLIIGIKL
jgi:hypothetical protein